MKNKPIRNSKPVISSSNKNKISLQENLPEHFYSLTNSQQSGILKILQYITSEEQQQIMNEWDMRCNTQKIKSPAAYLYGIIQKAIRGELYGLLVVTQNNQQNNPHCQKVKHH